MPKQSAKHVLGAIALLLGLTIPGGLAGASQATGGDAVYTSTRQVTSLAVTPDGAVWVGTTGGVLRRDADGKWLKFTRANGLPAHEVQGFVVAGNELAAIFPGASAVWRQDKWQVEAPARAMPSIVSFPQQTAAATWRSAPCAATVDGLRVKDDGKWRLIGLPKSSGSHISALLPRDDTLWAAFYGDGLWAFGGRTWRRLDLGLPAKAREVTALAMEASRIWVGTRREGVWEFDGLRWQQHLQPDEPYSHNCQFMAIYRDALFVSTLEDGLAVRTPEGWRHVVTPTISSDAPRQMAQFGDSLYLRHADGKVDRFDGERWARAVCAGLPRKQASAIAADRDRLYVAQWGGWSEFDGTAWTHHLKVPDLQGIPVTTLCPQGSTLWVGTQGRGLAEIDRPTGRLRWHDERNNLPDDWVTCMTRAGQSLWMGTFVGGPARKDGDRWTPVAKLAHENVTALVPDDAGGVLAATRTSIWRLGPNGEAPALLQKATLPDGETQTLCKGRDGWWIGARTGLYFLRDNL